MNICLATSFGLRNHKEAKCGVPRDSSTVLKSLAARSRSLSNSTGRWGWHIFVPVEDGGCNEHQRIANVSHSHDRYCQLHQRPKHEIYTIGLLLLWWMMILIDDGARRLYYSGVTIYRGTAIWARIAQHLSHRTEMLSCQFEC